VDNPLTTRRQLLLAANRVLKTRVAQHAVHFETLEERLAKVLPTCSVSAYTGMLELGTQPASTRALLNEMGVEPSRGLETRLGRILRNLGYVKVRSAAGARYLAPAS